LAIKIDKDYIKDLAGFEYYCLIFTLTFGTTRRINQINIGRIMKAIREPVLPEKDRTSAKFFTPAR